MGARYIQLSDDIISDISIGKLALGQRMPSIRKMTQRHQVSMTTVVSCYHRLEEQGWLCAKPQSGFFVSEPLSKSSIPEFETFQAIVTTPRQVGAKLGSKNLGPFYAAQLSHKIIPIDILNRAQLRACKRVPEHIFQYPEVQGGLHLRSVLSSHFSQHYFPLSAEHLVVTNGCIDAVRIALEVTTNVGDVVAVSSPCFNGLLDLLQSMDRMIVEIPCLENGLDLAQLEEQLAKEKVTACLLSSSYINPQGISFSAEHKQRILQLSEQYQTPIIEDDVYLELGFNKAASLPIKHWDKQGWVLWCGSVSKTIAAGYRMGWCEPGRYFERYMNHLSGRSFGVSNLVQATLAEFIDSGQYLKHLKNLRLELASHALDYHLLLRQCLGEKAKISAIEGGLVLWVQITGLNTQLLKEKADCLGIYFRIGSDFTSRNCYSDCFRLNIGWSVEKNQQASEENLREQLVVLCRLIEECLE